LPLLKFQPSYITTTERIGKTRQAIDIQLNTEVLCAIIVAMEKQ